jgi:hypothetical protein
MFGSIISLLGTVVGGFFNFKGQQAEVLKEAMNVVSDVSKSDDARATAAAQIIAAEASSESWITRTWRPLVVLCFTGILLGNLTGLVNSPVSEAHIDRMFDLVEISVLGYMGMRSADKWVRDLRIGNTLSKFITKKLG